MRDFYAEIGDILGSGGTDYAIIPLGDPAHENAAHTTCTTVGSGGGDGLVVTYRPGTRDDYTVPVAYSRNQHRQPTLHTGGNNDGDGDSPPAAFWSFISGGVDAAGSIGCWVNTATIDDAGVMMAKWIAEEWIWARNATRNLVQFRDESAGVTITGQSLPFAQDVGIVAFMVMTYDGRGGVDAVDGVNIYKNTVEFMDNRTNNASYVDMEDGSVAFEWGDGSNANNFIGDFQGGGIGPFKTNQELTVAQVLNLYHIGLAAQRPTPSPIWRRH